MIAKVKQWAQRWDFNPDLPLEYRIYMIFFLESLGISILSATTNTLLGKGLLGIALQWGYVAFCIVLLCVPLRVRMRVAKPMLIFIALVYIPFLFFQTAGYDGTALQFSLLGVFLLAIGFSGRQRALLIGLDLLIYLGVCVMQYRSPGLIVPHATEADKLVDLLVALTLSIIGLAVMTVYIKTAYENERDRIRSLLEKLSQSNERLAEMSVRDALTGAYNRRYMTEFLARELETAERTGKPLALLMLDIDHFKEINDQFGHGFGDEVLVAFSKVVEKNLRTYDVLARYGGEEFVVALHAMDLPVAREVAERVRAAVEALTFRNGAGVTVSIGLVLSKPGERMDVLLERADARLYDAKHGGRNRVVADT